MFKMGSCYASNDLENPQMPPLFFESEMEDGVKRKPSFFIKSPLAFLIFYRKTTLQARKIFPEIPLHPSIFDFFSGYKSGFAEY